MINIIWGHFNIKALSHQYRNSHYNDKVVLWRSYLYDENIESGSRHHHKISSLQCLLPIHEVWFCNWYISGGDGIHICMDKFWRFGGNLQNQKISDIRHTYNIRCTQTFWIWLLGLSQTISLARTLNIRCTLTCSFEHWWLMWSSSPCMILNGGIILVTITGTTILTPYHIFKSLHSYEDEAPIDFL